MVSSALFLFGLSYLYGLAGTTNMQGLADALRVPEPRSGEGIPGLALVAVVLVVVGPVAVVLAVAAPVAVAADGVVAAAGAATAPVPAAPVAADRVDRVGRGRAGVKIEIPAARI